ncbi:MAG: integrase [Caulobacter sp.]|nr:integrase [Vitreoscilla sp.]
MQTRLSAWNKGRLLGQKPPLKPKEIWSLRIRLQLVGKPGDLALFNFAIYSKLRGCDLVSPRVRAGVPGGGDCSTSDRDSTKDEAAGKLESTVRYLGIEVDDALEILEQTEI